METSRGWLTLDVGFGGAFYGALDVRTVGLAVTAGTLPELIALQRELRPALERALDVVHPVEPELRDIYGIVFWEPLEGGPDAPRTQRNVTVFADGEVDRSPCGSGTSARLAMLHGRGEIDIGQPFQHRSIVDSAFDASIVDVAQVAGRSAVITEVEGSAFRTGEHTFTLDARDPIGAGFLIR